MPHIRRRVRLTGGALPEARRGRKSSKAGGKLKGAGRGRKGKATQAGNGSLTAARKAEITEALLAKWEKEDIGNCRKDLGAKPGRSGAQDRGSAPVEPITATAPRVAAAQKPKPKRHPGAPKKTEKTRPGSPQPRRPVPGKNMPAAVARKPFRPIAPEERRQLELQVPGVGRLIGFLNVAGVSVESGRRGSLRINGIQTPPLAGIRPSPQSIGWNSFIDEITLRYARGHFVKAVADNARFGEGLRAFLRPREKGFAIMHGQMRLAMIHPTRAYVAHHGVVEANFLKPGVHWQQVADLLPGAEAKLVAEGERALKAKAAGSAAAVLVPAQQRRLAAQRRIDLLPDDISPGLFNACMDASQRIRLDRQVAYARVVVLTSDLGELTLLPIAHTGTRLLAPFRLSKEAQVLEGSLILGDRDPLPLLIGRDVTDHDAIAAWTCALLGFADATCVDLEPVGSATTHGRTGPAFRPPSSSRRERTSTRVLPRRRPWPSYLEPVGDWTRHTGSFVAGHRRRLNDDQMASNEARDRARKVGITLKENETWVRPHARGIPDDVEMRFRWYPPTETKGSAPACKSAEG